MKGIKLRIAVLCVAVAVLFTGCGAIIGELTGFGVVKYRDMEYSRPDMNEMERILQESCDTAANGKNLDQVLEGIYGFYEVYDNFHTSHALAEIRYSTDLTDLYWEEEYNFCLENASQAEAALEELYFALAASPYREELEGEAYFGADFFDAYEGESLWTEELLALMEQEAQLQGQYYALSSQAMDAEYYSDAYFTQYGTQMAELFVELIALRQQIAGEMGYDSYPEFAYELYHYRDYTPAQTEAYLTQVGQQMVGMYQTLNQSNVWETVYGYCSEEDTFQYVKTAAQNMGGHTREAFSLLETAGLYDISYGENKADGSFEAFLWSYYEPFVFVSPYLDQADKLLFAHEFGHFTNDYVCGGSAAGTDVAEVHSQAMEYLSLFYGDSAAELEAYKLADCLCTYVEQSAYALFEQRVYELEGEELTVENIQALYTQICTDFGFATGQWGWDDRDYVLVEHFYISPMYIVSYVVSNDVAFQIYQQEKQTPGKGLATYENCLESMDSYLLQFAETYGLESPFAPGRLESVKQTLETGLSPYLLN